MNRLLPVFFLLTWSWSGAAQTPSAGLFQAIGDRLGYMQGVALYKAVNFLPVEDLERERLVLAKAVANAASVGLDPGSVESFFKAQIAVAKAIQYRYRAELLTLPDVGPPPDLDRVVRPRLIQLGNEIIERLAADIDKYGRFQEAQFDAFAAAIDDPYVVDRDKRLLFDALREVSLSERHSALAEPP